jgi:hypothetical protein
VEALVNGFEELFVPDLLMPEQFFDRMRRKFAGFEGERKMLLEILVDAIECWQGVAVGGIVSDGYFEGVRQRLYREAEFWIFGNYGNPPHFSFTQACEWLGLDPDFIRRGLLEWKSRRRPATVSCQKRAEQTRPRRKPR